MSQENSTVEGDCREALPIVAVDIGNARIKVGRFEASFGWQRDVDRAASPAGGGESGETPRRPGRSLPSPIDTLSFAGVRPAFDELSGWLDKAGLPTFSWWIGSVNRPATTILLDWLRDVRPNDPVMLLASTDLPLAIRVPEPDKVGVDRLLDAVAADVLREPGRPAVVVDMGTAITVDLVAADGAFCGGAILPGIAMSARALSEFTDLLPEVDVTDLPEPPPPVGKSTVEAMQSGLFWFAVGAIRELATRMAAGQEPPAASLPPMEPNLFLTGGAGAAVAALLGPEARLVPHLTLSGIALTAQAR